MFGRRRILERRWKAAPAYLRYYFVIFLEGRTEAEINLSQLVSIRDGATHLTNTSQYPYHLSQPARYNRTQRALVHFFFLVSWGGMRLSPLCTSATNWPIVPGQNDRWRMWSSRWKENWQGKPKYSEKTCPSATLSTTNPTWPDLGSNPGRCGGAALSFTVSI
jgi:hypothetical protein